MICQIHVRKAAQHAPPTGKKTASERRIPMKYILTFLLIHSISVFAAALDVDSLLPQLSLSAAENLWRQKNREVQLAHSLVDAADADRLSARQRPNPQLSLNTGSLTSNGGVKQSDAIVRIDQTFERGGKRELRMKGADLRLSAAREDLADTARQSLVALAQAYFDLVLAQEKLTISQSNALLFEKTVAAARLKLQVGDIARSELSRIRVDALRAENDVRQAQSDVRQAQVSLAYMIGAEALSSSIHAADHWPLAQSMPLNPEMNIDQRPDVRSAVLRLQAANAARDLALAFKTRDVTLGFQYERNGSNAPSHSVGVGISIPLLTGYEYEGEIRHAEVDALDAEESLERVRAQAFVEISRAIDSLENAAQRVKRFQESLLSEAAAALDSAEFAYLHGGLSVMDLLDARRVYKATLLESANAEADYAKALTVWRHAQGESHS